MKQRVAAVQELIEANGEYIVRPPGIRTRNIENQREEARNLIDARPGAGCRIPREKIWGGASPFLASDKPIKVTYRLGVVITNAFSAR